MIALDQASKTWAVGRLAEGDIELIGSLRLHLSHNTGMSFSLGAGRSPLFAVVGVGIVAVVVWMARSARSTASGIGFGLVIGGAVGNLTDRFLRAGGAVVDFIDLQWWPVFNLADSFLFIGAGLLILVSLREGRRG